MELKALEECTPSQRDFIGTTFPTPKGGVLTVVGCCKEKIGRHALFKVECSICSKDVELFPDGFRVVKGHLVRGGIPCGCSNSPMWDKNHYEVLVKRECEKRSYKFLGWNGEFIGVQTKIKLYNVSNGNSWNTTSINGFLNDNYGCPAVKSVNTGNRCRKPYEDVVRKLKDICTSEGHSFVATLDYKNMTSKFRWVCKEGHNCETVVKNFLRGARCRTCKRLNINSDFCLYKDRVHEKDYLYIYKIKGQPYIKVGRSFEPNRRLKVNQRRINKYYANRKHKITQTHLFTGTHEEIYNLEQEILTKEFITYGVDLDDGYGSSELLKEECYDDVVRFCEKLLEQGVIRSG